jgi:hypothetical protein
MARGADWCQECGEPPRKENRVETHATDVECPTCYAWVGWACNGSNYGYHAAGYHPARERAAKRADEAKAIDLATLQATPQARTADE